MLLMVLNMKHEIWLTGDLGPCGPCVTLCDTSSAKAHQIFSFSESIQKNSNPEVIDVIHWDLQGIHWDPEELPQKRRTFSIFLIFAAGLTSLPRLFVQAELRVKS